MKKSYHDPGLTAAGRCKLFDEENGPFIYWSGYLLFENGAVRENNFYGCLWEPPTEPYALWKRKAEYWRARLTMAVRDFDNFKEHHISSLNQILNSNDAGSVSNGDEIIANLKKLQKVVTDMNEKAQECLAMVKKYDPQEARKQRQQEQSQKNKEQAALLKKKIAAIQI